MDNSLWVSIELKAAILALAGALGVLGVTFGVSPWLPSGKEADSKQEAQRKAVPLEAGAASGGEAREGRRLFEHNCAHCHGEDARGDEGPNLHGLRKSDARLSTIIKGGIKGEMPAFAKKFQYTEVQALIAYLRTLKD